MSIGHTADEFQRVAAFAETGNGVLSKERLKKRLSQDRRPSTRSSSETWVNWAYMSDILGQPFDSTRIPLSKLEQMQRDPILSFGLMFVKVPLIRAPWYIKSTDARRAAFVDNALRRIYGRLILAYTNSFSFGYSAMVKRFEYEKPDWTFIDKDQETQPEKKVWDTDVEALVWKPFLALNPKTVAPHWNHKGEFAGIDFQPNSAEALFGTTGSPLRELSGNSAGRAADIPVDWALWATNEKDSVYGSLWGYPRLGYAYRYWWSYWYKFGLSDRAFEKWADPPVIVYHPTAEEYEGDEVVDYGDAALALAEQLRSGANAAVPSETHANLSTDRISNSRKWEIEQMKAEANFDALDTTFKYLDVLKLRSMMIPEQSLIEGQGGSSSRNVAEKFGDIFQESQAVVMQEIDDLINRYMIPQILEANFGSGGAKCEKVTTGFDTADLETMRTVIGAIANKHGGVPDVDVREMLTQLGLPLLTWAETQRKMEEIAKQEALKTEAEVAKLERTAQLKGHKPPATDAKFGFAGVNEEGLYFDSRDRIDIRMTKDQFKEYLGEIATKDSTEGDKENAKIANTILSEIEKLAERESVVNVEVKVPEVQQPETKKIRKTIVRDDNGDIAYIDEQEVEDDRTEA